MKPVRLKPDFRDRPWGSTKLQPWFEDTSRETGEVWFRVSDRYPLLVKFLFTSRNLSVQVHPNDAYAGAHHDGSRGKSEMWHILRAEQTARIALGFTREVTKSELREAAVSGNIVDLLRWVPVQAGETYYVPAGTVHAIGAGIVLCEVQQNSDVTYRLYDYDREPRRELHLDHGVEVSDLGVYEAGSIEKVASEYFVAERFDVSSRTEHMPRNNELLVALEGDGKIAGEPFRLGDVWHSPDGTRPFAIDPNGTARFLRTHPV